MGIGLEAPFKKVVGSGGEESRAKITLASHCLASPYLVSSMRSEALNVAKIEKILFYLIPSLSVEWVRGGGDGEQAYHCL